MNRRQFLQTLGLTAFGCATGCASGGGAIHGSSCMVRPNIVFILVDDMGWGDIRVLNPASHIPTPNLDRLARQGLSFTDAHAGSAACTPTRYSLMTGRHCWRTRQRAGVLGGFDRPLIEKGRVTVPSLLRDHGYATACFGKWHLGMTMPTTDGKAPNDKWNATNIDWKRPIRDTPNAFGFDVFYGMAGSLDMPPYLWIDNDRFVGEGSVQKTTWRLKGPAAPDFEAVEVLPEVTRRTVEYIEGREGKVQPFFLYMPMPAPHTPLVPAPEFQGKTDIGPYGDYCVEVDAMVGKVCAALERTGLAENTLLMFSSDNGFWRILDVEKMEAKGHLPSGGFRGYKAEIHEGGHRVPFFVRWPGRIASERVSPEPVCLTDLLATCADLIGVRLPADAGEDSLSLLPVFLNEPYEKPLHESILHHGNDGSLGIRKGKWKLARCPWDGNSGWRQRLPKGVKAASLPAVQLFDMELDPHETRNVQAEHPEVVKELSDLLQKYETSGRSVPLVTLCRCGPK